LAWRIIFFNRKQDGNQPLDAVIRIAAKELNWDSATVERETEAIEKMYANTVHLSSSPTTSFGVLVQS